MHLYSSKSQVAASADYSIATGVQSMSLLKGTFGGLLWSFLETGGSKAISFFVFLILARLLEPDAFGLLALALVFVSLLETLVDQGFGDAIVQRSSLEEEHLDTAFWANLGLGALIALLVLLAAPVASSLFGEPELASVLRWMSLAFILQALSGVQSALLRRELKFRHLSIRTLLAQLAGGIVAIMMAFQGFGVWSLVGQQLTQYSTGAIILWQVCGWTPRLTFSRAHFSDLWTFGIHIVGAKLLNFVNRKSDDLLIGAFLGATSLGYYTVAYKILRSLTSLLGSVAARVAFPVFSRLQNDIATLRRAFLSGIRYVTMVAFPLFTGLALLAHEIIPLFLGDKWTPSIPILHVLAWIGLIHPPLFLNDSVFLAIGKPAWRLKLTALNAVTNFIGFAIAVQFGVVAVAAAYVIRAYLVAPIPILILRNLIDLKVNRYLKQFITPALATVVMASTMLLFGLLLPADLPALHVVIAETAFAVLTFLLAVHLLAPAFISDLRTLLLRVI